MKKMVMFMRTKVKYYIIMLTLFAEFPSCNALMVGSKVRVNIVVKLPTFTANDARSERVCTVERRANN